MAGNLIEIKRKVEQEQLTYDRFPQDDVVDVNRFYISPSKDLIKKMKACNNATGRVKVYNLLLDDIKAQLEAKLRTRIIPKKREDIPIAREGSKQLDAALYTNLIFNPENILYSPVSSEYGSGEIQTPAYIARKFGKDRGILFSVDRLARMVIRDVAKLHGKEKEWNDILPTFIEERKDQIMKRAREKSKLTPLQQVALRLVSRNSKDKK